MRAKKEDLGKLFDLCDRLAHLSRHIEYDRQMFIDMWENYLDSGVGVIFCLPDFKGMLAAMCFPIPHNGILTAVEQFWVVDETAKGRGIRLIKEFEKWAKDSGCKKVIVNHMADLPIGKLYERMGYEPYEFHYIKEV